MKQSILSPLYNQSLIVDLYELTMAAGYFSNSYNYESTFELFIREMPPQRSFLVAAGLQQVMEYLTHLKFGSEELDYLRNLPTFKNVDKKFWEYLENFRFTGDVWGIPEGQIVFAGEPLLRVTAPMIEAQVIETFALSMINFQTLIASKAARVVHAAELDGKKRGVMEFGSRRAHGPEASALAARASYLAGCAGTSNVLAGQRYGIPALGTAAHSWTMAFPGEVEAFRAYHNVFPDSTVLLIDTYDIEQGARNAVKIGKSVKGVRIDSGDLDTESRKVREILDAAGMKDTQIVASGDLNEHKIKKLVEAGAPIDSFGVGTQMATSADAPYLGGIYKLVEQRIKGETLFRAKFSENKATYPAKKQIYRIIDERGNYLRDIIGRGSENISEKHTELLVPVIRQGKLVYEFPELKESREFFHRNLARLERRYKEFDSPDNFPVTYSRNLQDLFDKLKEEET
ncbi:MAG: nicotinate phosphoribosyltransferase [Calditrichia bacterium]